LQKHFSAEQGQNDPGDLPHLAIQATASLIFPLISYLFFRKAAMPILRLENTLFITVSVMDWSVQLLQFNLF